MNLKIIILLALTILLSFAAHFEAMAAEPACPPLVPGTKPHFTGYVMCDGNGPNCQEFELPEGGAKFLDLSTRVDLVVQQASVSPRKGESSASSLFTLEEGSVCRNKRFTRKFEGKKIALVGAGKILVMPKPDSQDYVSEVFLSGGPKSTYRENAEVCVAVFPDCKTGNVSWLSLKEGGERSFEKIYRAVAGEKSL